MSCCGRRRCRNCCARPAGRSWRQKAQTVQGATGMAAPSHRFRRRNGCLRAIARYLSQYDREHLYKQVWSAPMPKIGKHYGVTEVEIAKACRHLHIPTRLKGTGRRGASVFNRRHRPLPPLPASIPKHQTDERSS